MYEYRMIDTANVWFTSDWHLGHKNILKYEDGTRPFASIEEHDEAILQAVADTVGENDILYVLGDVCMGDIKKYANRIRDLPGTKMLVSGNHDTCWIGRYPDDLARLEKERQRYLDAGFRQVHTGEPGKEWAACYNAPVFHPSVVTVLLSHFPREGESFDGRDDRYAEYRPLQKMLPILCGHVHSAWKHKSNNVNVGIDVWGLKPVRVPDVVAYLVKEE